MVVAVPAPLLPPATPDAASLLKLQVPSCSHLLNRFEFNAIARCRLKSPALTRLQHLDAAIAAAESNMHPSDDDNDRLLNLYSEQRTLRAAIQSLMAKETVGGPAAVSFSHSVLQSAEELLVIGRGSDVADVVLDAFGPSGRGNGASKLAISNVGAVQSCFGAICSLVWPAVDAGAPEMQLVHRRRRSK